MFVSSLSQLRVSVRSIGSSVRPLDPVPIVGVWAEGSFVEGQTIRVRVRRGG